MNPIKRSFSFLALSLFVLFPSSLIAQDAAQPLLEYTNSTQLVYKITLDTNYENKPTLTITLANEIYKNQKLTLHLKRLWKSNVTKHCNGKFKGRPSIYRSSVTGMGRCLDHDSKRHYSCPEPVDVISGTFTCAVGS